MELEVVEPLRVNDRYVSSSWIRELILGGEIAEADRLLTQPYRVHGHVIRAHGRGATIGFPTANLDPVGMVLPPLGVYAGRALIRAADVTRETPGATLSGATLSGATLSGAKTYRAAIHIGPNPTFDEQHVKFEVHLLGCHETLYGRLLELDFLDRLRDIRPFANVDALRDQLTTDVTTVERIVKL